MASKGSRAQQVEVPFRTIRIGTLKAFPIPLDENDVSPHAKNTAPLILNESGVTFSFTIDGEYEPEKKLTIKISARRLERVECYVLRGCPVIWLTTDEKMARKIRSVCNMVDRNGFFYDPSSAVKGERHIAAITQQDPLPYTMGHSIQNIFKQLFRNQNKKVDSHFRIISQKHCNTKLVQCSTSMDEVKRKQLIYEQLQKRSKQKQITDDSNSSDSCDDEPDKVAPVSSSSNNSATSSNPPVPSTPPKAVVEKEVLSSSGRTVIESSPT
uniref:Uncharacterized protein n=1 Tax=Ciona intestinalis TaxID=7719 RepID=F6TT96_CIOIN